MKIARVFPRRTKLSPNDWDCYFGGPFFWAPKYDEVHISITFTWDLPKIKQLVEQWRDYGKVRVGGPALSQPLDNGFIPGMYLKKGITITSRGCPSSKKRCPWCFVPDREGKIRELSIHAGHIIQDNNLLACSKGHIREVFEMLRGQRKIDFSGGLEPDRITDEIVEELRTLKIHQIWLSYDAPDREQSLKNAVRKLSKYFPRDKLRCYVLIGYKGDTLDKAEGRLRRAWQIGTLPFAMRYRTPEREWNGTYLFNDRSWNLLTRQWSRPAITRKIASV